MASPRAVTFSNPDKVYFPSGYTKGEMLRYYVAVAPTMVPHLRQRPITLIRFPEGVKGQSFYEKNAPKHTPDWIRTWSVPRREHEGDIRYILVNDRETLAWCANLGAIEFHPFLHRAPRLERPTHIAFDLDPGEGANLLNCIEVALLLRELLGRLNLEAFPKVSGSKGIQLYLPLNTAVTYDAATPFAKSVAELGARQHPDLIVSEMPKVLRRGRVMIDWSQNVAAKTTVGVYSLRGKRDAPFVSAPVTWAELERAAKRKDPDSLSFSPAAALERIAQHGDLFAPVLELKQRLPKAFLQLPPSRPSRGSLARYAAKRDFSRTAEPAPAKPTRAAREPGEPRRFVIQKHAASHLHFDFRLELHGTLKSWAVPKGLPYETGVRRSAFEVEDHPLEYIDFEGTIPAGQYGGGTVMVWDRGTYEILGGDYFRGDLKLRLNGEKLRGEWHIFRIKSEEAKPVWLVIKAEPPMAPLSAKAEDTSVLTGRSMARIATENTAQWQSNRPPAEAAEAASTPAPATAGKSAARERAQSPAPEPAHAPPAAVRPRSAAPRWVEPMKPRFVAELPEGPQWLYEVKWDGYRAFLRKHGDAVEFLSRNEKPLGDDFPGLVEAAAPLPADSCLIDGEIVALDETGRPAFQRLQHRSATDATLVYYAFDLLALDGEDLRTHPLVERKERLARLLASTSFKLSPELPGNAADVLAAVTKLGLEGVVAKQRDSAYLSGERHSTWQKVRVQHGQEFVVGGYRPGMDPFESLLVGYYEGNELKFAGKVRPGLTAQSRREVWDLIQGDLTPDCPFTNLPNRARTGRWGEGITPTEMKTLRWVKPRHVVQIGFVEWTDQGHLRHASFQGIRTDKRPRDVHRETPAPARP